MEKESSVEGVSITGGGGKTRGDWSTNVCAADLCPTKYCYGRQPRRRRHRRNPSSTWVAAVDKKGVEWGKGVDRGGRRIIKKKNNNQHEIDITVRKVRGEEIHVTTVSL